MTCRSRPEPFIQMLSLTVQPFRMAPLLTVTVGDALSKRNGGRIFEFTYQASSTKWLHAWRGARQKLKPTEKSNLAKKTSSAAVTQASIYPECFLLIPEHLLASPAPTGDSAPSLYLAQCKTREISFTGLTTPLRQVESTPPQLWVSCSSCRSCYQH